MNTRLKQFIAAENITQSQFAEKIQVVRASVSHVLSGRNNPGYEFIKAIMLAYPNLNIEWLMLGKGKMYKDSSAESRQSSDPALMPEDSLFYELDTELYEANSEKPDLPSFQNLPPDVEIEQKNENLEPIFSQSNTPQVSVKQRKAVKVMIFFDDGTYQEM